MTTWLVIDGHNLAWRSHHALKGLSHKGKLTGALFGFLRDTVAFQRKFKADNCVICFDKGRSLREKVYPGYKAHRKGQCADLEERVKERNAVREQMVELEAILPAVGFKNVLSQEGYEADDLIAAACQCNLLPQDEAVIIGSDQDLLQLLSGQVSIWNFRQHVTLQSFWKEWQLKPEQWADVKALAGCKTDGIRGVRGVGEITAARYLRKELKTGKGLTKIESPEGIATWNKNLRLVQLPWPGVKPFFLRDDEPDPDAWDYICLQHGMDSLRGMLSGKRGVMK